MYGQMIYGRYMYRKSGSSQFGPWHYFKVFTNTFHGHENRIKELNNEFRNRLIWKWDEVLENDIDMPKEEK